MKRKIILILLLAIATVLTACSSGNGEGDGAKNEDRFSISTSPLGSGWYQVSITLADVWMDNIADTNINVLEGGSIANIRGVNEGKDMMLGWAYTPDLMDAYSKEGSFKEENIDNVKVVALGYPVWLSIFTKEKSSIKSLDDLLGKKVHAGGQGTGSELAFQRLLEEHGLSYEKIEESGGRVSFGNYNDAATQLQDGIVDVAVAGGAPEVPAFKEIENLNDIRLVPVEQSKLDSLTSFGYREDLPLPKGTYKNQDEGITAVAYQSLITVNKDMSEDRVYELTKAMWENVDTIIKNHPARGEYFTTEVAVTGLDEDMFHPGAIKYYKEIGAMK